MAEMLNAYQTAPLSFYLTKGISGFQDAKELYLPAKDRQGGIFGRT